MAPWSFAILPREGTRFAAAGRAINLYIIWQPIVIHLFIESDSFNLAGPVDGISDQVTGEVDGFNSAILSKHGRSLQPTAKKTYPLGPTLLRCLRERATSKLLEVIRFLSWHRLLTRTWRVISGNWRSWHLGYIWLTMWLLLSYMHTEMARILPPGLSVKCCSIPWVINADGKTFTTNQLQETNLLFVGGQCFLEGGDIRSCSRWYISSSHWFIILISYSFGNAPNEVSESYIGVDCCAWIRQHGKQLLY